MAYFKLCFCFVFLQVIKEKRPKSHVLHICYSICYSVTHLLYNFAPRGVCILEKVNTSVGNQIVGFNLPFKRKARVSNIAL